jgi:hypothetical protein
VKRIFIQLMRGAPLGKSEGGFGEASLPVIFKLPTTPGGLTSSRTSFHNELWYTVDQEVGAAHSHIQTPRGMTQSRRVFARYMERTLGSSGAGRTIQPQSVKNKNDKIRRRLKCLKKALGEVLAAGSNCWRA